MAKCTGADDFKDTENPKICFNNSANFKLQMKMEAGGNDQWIVRNKSSLQVHFGSATAKKYASISKYLIDFAGSTREVTSPGNHNVGVVNSSQNLTLKVSAIDSRGNSTTLSKKVTIFDWIEPIINVSAARINNFENEIKLKSNTEISSVNNINAITFLQYRAKKVDKTEWAHG